MIKETLYGPQRAKLHLDQSRWHPNDPGADTPALVEYKGKWATYHCALGEGECDGERLPQIVIDWLNSEKVFDKVEDIYK